MSVESEPRARTARTNFSSFRFGHADPSVRIVESCLAMASQTADGPAWTLAHPDGELSFGGRGADAVRERRADPAGTRDAFTTITAHHPIVAALARDFGDVRIGSSADVYKAALTATLGQRITAAEAVAQWGRLCRSLGTPIDTPVGTLMAPPDPVTLSRLVPYQLHTFGIEEARARTIIGIARVFARPGAHQTDGEAAVRRLVSDVPRFGPWTTALVRCEALGDPDAVAVGDFHLKNVVAHALNGRARGTDDEMLDALRPYAGQRGRILMWLGLAGVVAPKFAPRRRCIDIRRI